MSKADRYMAEILIALEDEDSNVLGGVPESCCYMAIQQFHPEVSLAIWEEVLGLLVANGFVLNRGHLLRLTSLGEAMASRIHHLLGQAKAEEKAHQN